MSVKIAIIGATGYTGFELVRLLSLHPYAEISAIVSRSKENIKLQDVYPALNTITTYTFETLNIDKISDKSDIIFTALPHKASMEIVSRFLEKGKKVIDLSADFRFSNIETYEKYYAPHLYKNVAVNAVYGLPEIYRNKIKNSSLIANPGCYPTSAILALYPLLKNKIKLNKKIIVDSKSGVTGAGRNPSLKTLFTEVHDNFSAYAVGKHRHEPEIEEKCSEIYSDNLQITFTPHLLPINRGILSTIYVDILEQTDFTSLFKLYTETYENEPFIRVLETPPSTAMVKASNYCYIGLNFNNEKQQLIIVSVIDNIVKGASGQAIQNMNLICGFEETAGLVQIPTYL